MRAFVATRRGYVSHLDQMERDVLADVTRDVAGLVSADDDARSAPMDPAVVRLFPSASMDDPDLASEIRDLIREDIADTKTTSLAVVQRALDAPGESVLVPHEKLAHWLRALNDIRLVLAARLDIGTDEDAEHIYQLAIEATRDESPAETLTGERHLAMASLYAGITWWQGSLLEAVESGPRGH